MAMSTEISVSPVPTYFIYRDVPEGQLYDPTAPLAFCPPKDSDELFDALRAKFPHLKSHSERMRDATIEFLLEEREAEALSANVSPAMPSLYDSMVENSPWQQSWPSVSMTTLSSPEMANLATPAFENSPKVQIPHLMRSQSSTGTPSDAQTPALDSMTSVFSLSTSEQPKQRMRRKMTESEKVEYRKRRIVKACDTCSKRKRKCIHKQPEMEDLKKGSKDKTAHKITKPRHSTAKQPQAAEVSFPFDHHATNPSDSFAADGFMGGYEDFTLIFNEPTLDFNVDDFMPFELQELGTKPDNFRQHVPNSDTSTGRSHSPLESFHAWDISNNNNNNNNNAAGSFSGLTQSFDSAAYLPGLSILQSSLISHGSQSINDHESRVRCDLSHNQLESGSSSAVIANAGQLDVHGIQPAVNATSNPADLGLFTPLAHTSHVCGPRHMSQLDSDRSPGEGDWGRLDGAQAEPPVLISGDLAVANAASRQYRRQTMGMIRSAAGTSSQLDSRRHRTRSDGVYDPALQSEQLLTAAASSSAGSKTELAATLEGRSTGSGGSQASQQSSWGGDRRNSLTEKSGQTTLNSNLTTRNSLMQEASPPLSSPALSRTSPSQPTSTRATRSALSHQPRVQSALLARSSPFDNTHGTHARPTELFRLRHRIPASLDVTAPATNLIPSAIDHSAQANGGAYPRPRTSEAIASGLATRHQTMVNDQPTPGTRANEANSPRVLFTESDTCRYRDHHGQADVVENAAVPTFSVASKVLARVAIATAIALGIVLTLMSTSMLAHSSSMILLVTSTPVVLAACNNTLTPESSSSTMLSRARHVVAAKRGMLPERFGLHRPVGCV